MNAARIFVTAYVATLIRRNVQPLFRSWGETFLGAVLTVEGEYRDVYVTRQGEFLMRFGNGESDYGALGSQLELAELGEACPPHYRFAIKLRERAISAGKAYRPAAYQLRPREATAQDAEPEEHDRTCSICDGLGHGYPGGGPCPLEVTGERGVPYQYQ